MRVLVFGATGSAGGSVLNVCLEAPLVDEVQVVTRRPLTKAHEAVAKLRVVYQLLRPLGRVFAPFQNLYVAGKDIGLAMLQATTEGIRHRIIENAEIRAMARRAGPSISGAVSEALRDRGRVGCMRLSRWGRLAGAS